MRTLFASVKEVAAVALAEQARPTPGSAAWWMGRPQRADRRVLKDGLTSEAIVEAALAIVQSHGADALTMRRVAENLGTGAASLYRHVAGREELIALVVDHVLGLMKTPPPSPKGSRAELESRARRFRDHLRTHIEVVPLIRSAQMLGPNSMAAREAALAELVDLGLSPGDAIAAYLAMIHFTVANVQLDIRTGAHDDEGRRHLHALFADQDPLRFPTVVTHAATLAEHTSDAEFEVGLAAILDWIAARGRNLRTEL